jgi:shikimate kinase
MAEATAGRVVLLGLMASGKTTVGRLLAGRLGWRHLDLDQEIERAEGRTVAEIFRSEGEPYFRRREAELTVRLLESPGTVLTPGGGWVTNPSLFDLLPPETLTVWLRVSPEEVARRIGEGDELRRRPLLRGTEVLDTVRRLLEERGAQYARAAHHVQTDARDAESVAREIESFVRGGASSPPRS